MKKTVKESIEGADLIEKGILFHSLGGGGRVKGQEVSNIWGSQPIHSFKNKKKNLKIDSALYWKPVEQGQNRANMVSLPGAVRSLFQAFWTSCRRDRDDD